MWPGLASRLRSQHPLEPAYAGKGIALIPNNASHTAARLEKGDVDMSFKTNAAAALFAATTLLGACAHHSSVATNDDYGRVDTAQANGSTASTSPALIPGPAKTDDSGRVYTSSSAGGAGNASIIGTNTNVNIVPDKKPASTASVTYTPAETTETTTTVAEVVPPPPPAPVVVAEVAPPPAPVVVTETESAPSTMASSTSEQQETTTTTKTTRRRMSKD
jgi:hypothetical protein